MGFDEQEYTRSFDIRSWKKLLPFLQPYRGLIAVVLVLNVVCAVIDIALPLFQRYAINAFIETGDVSGLPGFALFYGCIIGLQALAVILFTRRSMRIEMQPVSYTHLPITTWWQTPPAAAPFWNGRRAPTPPTTTAPPAP